MIVVDTSAIIAIDQREPAAVALSKQLIANMPRYIPATAVVEATMVLSRNHKNPKAAMDEYIALMQLTIVPIDAAIAGRAQEAFEQFGKGRHPAKLNLCDCFSYAVAKAMDMPLLFIGSDFPLTDIRAVA